MLIGICGPRKALVEFWNTTIAEEFPEAYCEDLAKATGIANSFNYITAFASENKPPVDISYYSYSKPASNRMYLLNVKSEREEFLNKIKEVYNGELK